MEAYNDFDASRMTLKALADGGGAGYGFRGRLRYTSDRGRRLMLTNAKHAFLQALAKMPTKKEGIAPVLRCGLLLQGLTCPRKGKNMQISNQSMPSCS